jgi:hypothetical protein
VTSSTNRDLSYEELESRMTAETGIRELDRRQDDGIDVTLFWNSRTNRLFVAVQDERGGESFRVDVDAADALDAFHHPYAYANRAYVGYAVADWAWN